MLKRLWKRYKEWKERPVKRMVEQFVEAFPGRCMICSYHAYGVRERLTKELYPPPHDCIEDKKNSIKKGETA